MFSARRRQPGKTPTPPGIFPQLRVELRYLPVRSIVGRYFDTLNSMAAIKGKPLYFERRSAGQLLAWFGSDEQRAEAKRVNRNGLGRGGFRSSVCMGLIRNAMA